jgi:hypothetical protein
MGKRIKINFEMGGETLPNSVIDFTKFNERPLMLNHHAFDELPLGRFIDIKKSHKGVFGKAIFHKITPESKLLNRLVNQKIIKNVQPGGYVERDENGNITKFDIYEVSICGL